MIRHLSIVYDGIGSAWLSFDLGPGGLLWRAAVLIGMVALTTWFHTH